MRHSMKAASALLVIALVSLTVARGQSSRPVFQVTSVKPNNSGSRGARISDSPDGSLRADNTTVRLLLLRAYGVFDYQVVGSPDWINTARFDIEGKAESGLTKPDVLAMTRSLLEDRFKLRVHRDTRESSVFLLIVAKDGLKLQPTVEGRLGPGGLRPGDSRSNVDSTSGELSGSGIGVAKLIGMLVPHVGRPIIDKANLTGLYDFTLKFTPQQTTVTTGGDALADVGVPSIFTALTEQLGLKLESAKGPVEVLVIESVSRPSEN
jgi:uncharacterized protein (TIGR03435 family)